MFLFIVYKDTLKKMIEMVFLGKKIIVNMRSTILAGVLVLFLVSCGSPVESNLEKMDLEITSINKSTLSIGDLQSWIGIASSNIISELDSNILAVFWDIGDQAVPEEKVENFTKHTVLLSLEDQNEIISRISKWMDSTCVSESQKSIELERYTNYIKKGADVTGQFDVCKQSRLVLVAFSKHMNSLDKKHVTIHELYHAFQHDLGDENYKDKIENSENGRWVIEGTADYFANMSVAESIEDGRNTILKKAYKDFQADKNESIKEGGIAQRGAAAILRLVDQEKLSHKEIMSARLFYNGENINRYLLDESIMKELQNTWYDIEENGGSYTFN